MLRTGSVDGNSPLKQMRLVRDLLKGRLKPEGRLLLMSATPHQGNEKKFTNLLRLLSDGGYRDATGSLDSVAGRVIYRTKEDVCDWDGTPLFSKRQVNPPTFVQLGPDYHEWLDAISNAFNDADAGPAAWRKAQALQWAASSPKAGLAYLARLALRCELTFENEPLLQRVSAALLPYRGIPANTPTSVERVCALLQKQVSDGQRGKDDGEEVDIIDKAPVDVVALRTALDVGLRLVTSNAMARKLKPVLEWITKEAPAKFVVFATPIETVDDLQQAFEAHLGPGSVATITGGLKPFQRHAQMQAFRNEGVRVLVASKAGSEGVNLQVAHRLIHFDVPWNPMEMEQRVGRVHRYGSTQTVTVDTIVGEGSREEKMLDRCRARLGIIIEQLFGSEAEKGTRFEEMYSRVMTQLPAEELMELMAQQGFLSNGNQKLDELIQQGFEGWQAFDGALRNNTKDAAQLVPDRGHIRDKDMEGVFELIGARLEEGWSHIRLGEQDGQRYEIASPAQVWSFPSESDNVRRVTDRQSSLQVRGPDGFQGFVERAGINLPSVAAKLREIVGGASYEVPRSPQGTSFCDGAGIIRLIEHRWKSWLTRWNFDQAGLEKGAILLAWSLRLLHRGTPREKWTGIRFCLLRADGDEKTSTWLSEEAGAELMRELWEVRHEQNLVVPPHQRAEALFCLKGIESTARKLTPQLLSETSVFNPQEQDYEIVPVAALTIEARRESPKIASVIPPKLAPTKTPADLLEKLQLTALKVPPARSPGEETIIAIVLVDEERLGTLLPHQQHQAYSVTTMVLPDDRLADLLQLSQAIQLNLEPNIRVVEMVPLAEHFRSLTSPKAETLAAEYRRELQNIKLVVHSPSIIKLP